MARPRKETAEWFPHYSKEGGRTKFILESSWGNDGYAFWFKLLELLCRTNGYYYECDAPGNMKYLVALARMQEDDVFAMLDTLAETGKIDPELWSRADVIWCQPLVDNIAGMYAKRVDSVPVKPSLSQFAERKPQQTGQSGDGNPHNTIQYNTVHNTIPPYIPPQGDEQATPIPPSSPSSKPTNTTRRKGMTKAQQASFERFWAVWPEQVARGQAEKTWVKLDPDEELEAAIIEGVKRAILHDRRFRDGYIPHASTWLNQKGWLDKFSPRGESANGFRQSNGFRRTPDS